MQRSARMSVMLHRLNQMMDTLIVVSTLGTTYNEFCYYEHSATTTYFFNEVGYIKYPS